MSCHSGRVTFLLDPASLLLSVVGLAMLAVKLWALVDCATRPTAAFPAAGKLTKPGWLVILGLSVLFGGLGMLGLAGLVAAIVYLVDVRPAVRGTAAGGPWG